MMDMTFLLPPGIKGLNTNPFKFILEYFEIPLIGGFIIFKSTQTNSATLANKAHNKGS